MIKHLLYIASQKQIILVENLIKKLKGRQEFNQKAKCYRLSYPAFGKVDLMIHFLVKLDDVRTYLKERPIDILLYDERGEALGAIHAIKNIELWVEHEIFKTNGLFSFSMKRVCVVLDQKKNNYEQTFQLGRLQVRDIIISPDNSFNLLRWVSKLLLSSIKQNQNKIGLALSGGGLEGYLYQLGCCYALEQIFKKPTISDISMYSGVSSGSIMASLLAHKIPLREIVRSFFVHNSLLPTLKSSVIYDFAGKEVLQRLMKKSIAFKKMNSLSITERFLSTLPNGIFKGQAMYHYLESILRRYNESLSFDFLENKLFIGATDQKTTEHITFGIKPWDDISIVDAVRASCALIPIFTPWSIKNHIFIDGQISQACNIDILVKNGCNLIIIIDPLIPWIENEQYYRKQDLGGVFACIQTIKTIVHSRFRTQLNHLSERYPDIDFVIFQPNKECSYAMRGSPMKFRINTEIINLAYTLTLSTLNERYNIYSEKFGKFGFKMIDSHYIEKLQFKGLEVS